MKKVMKKVIVLMIILILMLGCSSKLFAETSDLNQLQAQFPTGTQWNDTYYGMSPSSTSTYIIRIVATECAGFAALMYYNYYGFDPYYYAQYSYDINSVKSGDIVRYLNDGHSVWIQSRSGNMCTIAECNFDGNNTVRWGVRRSISELSEGFSYIMTSDYEIGAENSYKPNIGKPQTVNATIASNSITTSWSAVEGATNYDVCIYTAVDWEEGNYSSTYQKTTIDARVTSLSSVVNDTDDYYVVVYARRGKFTSSQGGTAYVNKFTIGKPIRGISVTASKKEIEVGESLPLTIKYTPSNTDMDKHIQYNSSDHMVATVANNGVVI